MKIFLINLWHKRLFRRSSIGLISVFVLFILLDLVFPFTPQIPYSQIIEDRNGKVIHAFLASDQQWRMKCSNKDISPIIEKALLTKEDKWFYYHPGVNLFSVGRAFIYNIFTQRRTSGASTITMQLARMLHPVERTYMHKFVEVFHAFQLEWHFSKAEILEMYLNKAPYGGNIEGVKAAALLYFNREPKHLSIAQASLLAVVPNRPVTMRPGKNDSLLTLYRNKWLVRLQTEGVFTDKEIADAIKEPLGAKRQLAPQRMPHFSLWLRKQMGSSLDLKSTIRIDFQTQAELLLKNYMNRLKSMNVYNASILIIDNKTHQVLSYIGSPNYNDMLHEGQIDAVHAMRSPGSTLKPLIYASCFDKGLLTPKAMMYDVPENYDGYEPENYDARFNGRVSVEEALCKSLNLPAVKALHMVGKNVVCDKLHLSGCNQIGKDDKKLGLSLALGGCEMSLYQLVGLYTTFSNQGNYTPLKYLLSDSNKQTTPIMTKESAFMIADILSKLSRPDMPDLYKSNNHLPKVSWKTGTSYGRRDAWSIGFNKNYTIGVWIGNCTGKGVTGLTGAEVATPLLFDLFNMADYNSDGSWIKPPKSLGFRLVCSTTGKIPSEQCEKQVADFYIPGTSSMELCNHLVSLQVSADERFSYCNTCCPDAGFKTKFYENIEPSLAAYFDQEKIKYIRQPPHNPNCNRVFEGKAPKISMPVNNQTYMIEKATGQLLELHASCDAGVQTLYWYINDRYLRQSKPNEKVYFEPEAGNVKISCADDRGKSTEIEIAVKWF
ncbi:MAG: penicillin-binding protein 1C [Bacteroidetes bacterium]|nr:penicillin-binding protein 1C [Bacteroidota bacterium]